MRHRFHRPDAIRLRLLALREALELLKNGYFSQDQDDEFKAAHIGKLETLIAIGDRAGARLCRERAIADYAQNEYFRKLEIPSSFCNSKGSCRGN